MACKNILRFYDLKKKKSFSSSTYKTVKKGKRNFAVAQSPYSDVKGWRIIAKKVK